MSSNNKSKFKNFIKHIPTGNAGETRLRPYERELRPYERELRPEQPVAQRCKILKELGDTLNNFNLDETSITNLWNLTNDLIVPNKPAETRQIALSFYKRLIHTQYKNLTLMREKFFLVIQNHEAREDLRHLLELLDTLTENGKNITNFEEKIGKFMLLWIPAITEANLLCPYLDMLVNLIKFNAAHLDKDILVGIVQNACELSCTVTDVDIGLQCLTILEMVIGYTIFPSEPLPQCIITLCRVVDCLSYCPSSHKIMKNLLGTQLGYHSMKIMFSILNDRSLYDDAQLLRGAVFHLTMNIFCSNIIFQVSSMAYATNVLTGFLRALDSRQVIVTFEVILSVRKVINKTGLSEIIWDRICDIMSAIVSNIEFYEVSGMNKERLQPLQINFHENIDCIEKLLKQDRSQILGNVDRIYDLIERVAERRPEASVLALIEYRSRQVNATRPEWLQVLTHFIRRYYRMANVNVRIKTIESLVRIMDQNRACYEEEILNRVVLTHLAQIHQEPSVQVRVAVARALSNFALHCDTKRCVDLLDTLEALINRPFEHMRHLAAADSGAPLLEGSVAIIKNESEVADIIAAVDGLVKVFAAKLHRLPAAHAMKIFNILLEHLELHYDWPKIFEQTSIVRLKIFTWILKARANASYHIGYPETGGKEAVKFSHYLGIDSPLLPQAHATAISIRRVCKLIVRCLEQDTDFQVFELVIKELPKMLQNKALIQGNDIDELANTLFKINSVSNNKFRRSTDEFHALVLPAIASLVIYHECLQPPHHYSIITALNARVLTGIASVCINTMTILILEMPESLMRKLPEVLLQMSKMSDTNTLAIPVLEFLSLLIHLSKHLFTNFTSMHNMYVFAISLPYTKPHRYDHYTVSLAHHVIAGWFLKCKLELRKNCVNYIKSSMQSNAKMLSNDIVNLNSLNEDSSSRKRSTSLTERGSRKNATTRNDPEMRPKMNNGLRNFHTELAETCFDFLARHTFSPCPSPPKRLPAAEFLLKDGVSQTWLVGNNLVTITTSGCPSAPTRSGLCERCAQLGKAPSISLNSKSLSDATAPLSPERERRYTKVSLQHSSGNESAGSTELTSSSSSNSAATGHPHRQISNSSTASLDALSRRGSNPEALGGGLGDGPHTGSNTSLLGNSLSQSSASMSPAGSVVQQPVCVRACTGWAEIFIRRPTGNISWITRIQNPITNDCFGQDLPFNNVVSLFLPTAYGGVFGPDSTLHDSTVPGQPQPEADGEQEAPEEQAVEPQPSAAVAPPTSELRAKARALQRQEEIHSVGGVGSGNGNGNGNGNGGGPSGTAAIPIPRVTAPGKRGKEAALCGSVSDGEADDDSLAFEDAQNRARNPVRRVNSSPEMSSSWRLAFLTAKPAPLSQEPVKVADEPQSQLTLKKKSVQYSTKDMRVSCEAIPEEIAGSTPPQVVQDLQPESGTLPPKQHSADDVSSQHGAAALPTAPALQVSAAKPPLSPAPGPTATAAVPAVKQSPLLAANKITSFGGAPGAPQQQMQGVAKSSSSGSNGTNVGGSSEYGNNGNGNGDMMRGRSKTISTVREVINGKARPPPASSFRNFGPAKPPINAKLCMNPSFVFLQLYSTGSLGVTEMPLKLGPEHSNAVTLFDLVPPFETHKIGVLYVGQGQCNNEVEILRNSHGSTRYIEFLRNIGTLVSLKEAEQNNLFIGLDRNGADGKFAYIWKDDILQVTFHVATLMPTKLKDDPNCNEKKGHIGNDFVKIIYNESGEEYNLNTISGQFNYACVIVEPLELNSNRVYVKARSEISKFVCHPQPRIVSDRSAPLLARQMALHANLASLVYQSVQKQNPYASNWLERLRTIKRLRAKLTEANNSQQQSGASSGIGIHSSAIGSDMDDQRADFMKFT